MEWLNWQGIATAILTLLTGQAAQARIRRTPSWIGAAYRCLLLQVNHRWALDIKDAKIAILEAENVSKEAMIEAVQQDRDRWRALAESRSMSGSGAGPSDDSGGIPTPSNTKPRREPRKPPMPSARSIRSEQTNSPRSSSG